MIALRDMKNAGQAHLFLGDPMSSGIDKTVVEAGNAFSPGLWTLGVSLAVKNGDIVAPETRALPLAFEGGRPPVTVSRYQAGPGVEVESRLCHLGGPGWQGVDYLFVQVTGEPEDCCLVVRDVGPAGGKIDGLRFFSDRNVLVANRDLTFEFETPVGVEVYPVDGEHDSPFALAHFKRSLAVRVLHGYAGRAFPAVLPPRKVFPVARAFEVAKARWEASLPARVYAPDPRVARMWEQSAFHIQSAMEVGLPRIGVANYPIFWVRDCVIVLRALDLMGRSDLARIGCDGLAPLIFSGGFGCESDNPGEGVWALVNHYRMTGDAAWLRGVFPYIAERVRWIETMLDAEENIFRPADMRTIWAHSWPGSDLVCLPHEGGHIHGRMDGHSPDFYINCWAYAGAHLAAEAARALGEAQLADRWDNLAVRLDAALRDELLPTYGNERDSCAAPYPCGALPGDEGALKARFETWYRTHRLDASGARVPEALWTYFEAAQMHNAVLMGLRELAWASLDGYLDDPRWLGMSMFHEGRWNATEMLPFGTGRYGRGWLREGATGANMPHNWTAAETMNMLRSIFVVEKDDGLELLKGVPDAWLAPGARMGVCSMPTRFGAVSFDVEVGESGLNVCFTQGGDIPHVVAR